MSTPDYGDRPQATGPTVASGPDPVSAQPVNGPVGEAGPMAPRQPVDPAAPAAPGAPATPGKPPKPVSRSRLGGLWAALTSGAVILLLLLIFVLENGQSVNIAYFGAHGHLPLGVALLLAAIAGILLVVIPGAGRMLQLRLAARRQARRAQSRTQSPPPATGAAAPQQ